MIYKEYTMIELKVKALSVNKCWQGRRFKTKDYKEYELAVLMLLPSITIPKGKKTLKLIFGLSNSTSDVDNGIKPFLDLMQKKYKFNDREIYRIEAEKQIVKKGNEFIKFEIKEYGK